MAKDFGQLKTEIWSWTDTDSDRIGEAILNRIINDVINELARSADTLYNEFTVTPTTSAGTNSIDLTSSAFANPFSRPFSLYYSGSSGEVRVTYLSPEEFEKKWNGSSDSGEPEEYTIWGTSLLLGPTPDAAYTLTFRYYGYPQELSTDSQTNYFLTYLWDLVLYGCLVEATKYLLEDRRLQIFQPEYEKRRRRFIQEQARAKTAGRRSESHEPGYLE